ncbi:hypothetical protein V8F20_002042 [Naviculisporaceae sp. PSN 640]
MGGRRKHARIHSWTGLILNGTRINQHLIFSSQLHRSCRFAHITETLYRSHITHYILLFLLYDRRVVLCVFRLLPWALFLVHVSYQPNNINKRKKIYIRNSWWSFLLLCLGSCFIPLTLQRVRYVLSLLFLLSYSSPLYYLGFALRLVSCSYLGYRANSSGKRLLSSSCQYV